jgi:protein-L-isoaspartate(D-aspartate) O-methyltransferase
MDSREKMVDYIRTHYGLDSPKVLKAMLQVPREKFISKMYGPIAYRDGPVSIGHGQTMSQPYTVAFMTHLLTEKRKTKHEKVLEIGTGSGYQAAVLSHLVKEVCTVEIIPELAGSAKRRLKKLGYKNVFVKEGSGEVGWSEKAPYDAIIITAGVEKVPKSLFGQLNVDGVLVAPVGKGYDKVMTRFRKLQNSKTPKLKTEEFDIFHFVPFVEGKN